MSVDLSLFVLHYNTNLMNKLKLNDFLKTKNKNNSLTVQIFVHLQNHPTFHSEERLVNFVRGRECFVGLFLLLVYDWAHHCPQSSRTYMRRLESGIEYTFKLAE